jgi:predicted metal-dependent peptidase
MSTVDSGRILEEVTRTSIELLMREPFYSHFFSALNKEVVSADSSLNTLAVGMRERSHTLFINPSFWDKILTQKPHRYGVIKHEILHIVLKHTLEKATNQNLHLMNIAMDIVVNQYIDKTQLPDLCVFLEDFPELRLEQDQSWRYYYNKLVHLAQNIAGEYKDSLSAKNLQSIRPNSHGLERHSYWVDLHDQDEIERSLLDAQIDNLINIAHAKTSAKSYGTLAAGIRAHLDSILFKPKPLVDWRRVIRLFSESSSKTKVHNTLKRPSKRFGTVPGIKVSRIRKLLIAIDTSGSITKEETATFFNEVYHIWKQGTEIEVIECDAKIHRAYAFKGKPPEFILGRGGTDFNPPIRHGNTVRPDGLIYFTDGYAPPPTANGRMPILWVISYNGISKDSAEFKKLPGRKAKLNS